MAVPPVDTEALDPLVVSWVRAMRARNLAANTIRAYADTATQPLDHAAATGCGRPHQIGKPHIEAFLADLSSPSCSAGAGGHAPAPHGVKTATAVDRYLSARRRHAREGEPALWLGAKSRAPMTDSGSAKMIRRRGQAAGIHNFHPQTRLPPVDYRA